MKHLLPLAIVTLMACQTDETLTGYGDATADFVLQSIDGTPVSYTATLSLVEPGQVTGQAPCNAYGAALKVPYPWFELGPIAATKRACADLASENTYFTTLAQMTIVEVSGDILILSNEAQHQMVFQSAP